MLSERTILVLRLVLVADLTALWCVAMALILRLRKAADKETAKDKRIAELMENIAEITAERDLLKARKDRMIEKEMEAKPDPIDEATGQGRR